MTGTVQLSAYTLESLEIPIATNTDPTATPPEFSLSAAGAAAPGVFAAGVWSGAWVAGKTVAVTPTIATSGGALVITATSRYTLWAKITSGGEVAVWPVGVIIVV
jgi:hypothetical protein